LAYWTEWVFLAIEVQVSRSINRVFEGQNNSEGKNIEAMMCQQAVEKLNEYEGRLTDLKMKMTDSLKWNNIDDALRYHLAMRDCRDTAFRIIHVDLLLNSDQLRAFGISSKWST
uniref:Reverse transcriptase domain-containing protein n=1 Tax=Dracunculus medinensis TaxID=318479 RepID=A0A0N4UJ15_DRAME